MRGWLATGVLITALVACGGDDDSTATTSAGATLTTSPTSSANTNSAAGIATTVATSTPDANDDEAAAEHALLQLSDFPSGWTEQPIETSDEQAETQRKNAECLGSDQPTTNDLGGATAKTGDFTAPSTDAVRNAVSFAASEDEAIAHMEALGGDAVADCFATVTGDAAKNLDLENDAKVTDVTVAPLNVTAAGDDVVGYRMTVVIEVNNSTLNQYIDLVAVRVGRAVTSLQYQSVLTMPTTEDVDHYTALAAERLAGIEQ
jgi:hypothetical protein